MAFMVGLVEHGLSSGEPSVEVGLSVVPTWFESWLEARPELQLGLELRQLTHWTRTELWAKCCGEHPRCHLLNGGETWR